MIGNRPAGGDWRDAYENQQTRLYNFYSQSSIRAAFCAAARVEIAKVNSVTDADLPGFARAALVRLDQPFIDFFTGMDAWRDYYAPKVSAPRFVATIRDEPVEPPATAAVTAAATDDAQGNAAAPVADAQK